MFWTERSIKFFCFFFWVFFSALKEESAEGLVGVELPALHFPPCGWFRTRASRFDCGGMLCEVAGLTAGLAWETMPVDRNRLAAYLVFISGLFLWPVD